MMSFLFYTLIASSRVAESYITQVILVLHRWQTTQRVSQERAWVLALDAVERDTEVLRFCDTPCWKMDEMSYPRWEVVARTVEERDGAGDEDMEDGIEGE
jgi:hypothetical protein